MQKNSQLSTPCLPAGKVNSQLKRGFTLIELLLTMGLMSILLLVLSQVFISILDLRLESEATDVVAQDGRYILSRLTYDLNRASAITIPATQGGTGSQLQITISGVAHTYDVSGGNLTITTGGNSDSLDGYGTTVSNVSFTRLGNVNGKNTAQISFRLTSTIDTAGTGTNTRDFQTTVGIR